MKVIMLYSDALHALDSLWVIILFGLSVLLYLADTHWRNHQKKKIKIKTDKPQDMSIEELEQCVLYSKNIKQEIADQCVLQLLAKSPGKEILWKIQMRAFSGRLHLSEKTQEALGVKLHIYQTN